MVNTQIEDLELWRDFLSAHAHVSSSLEDDLQNRAGFPLTWYDVLFHLSDAPGGKMRLQDLADKLLFSRSGLTRLVDRIEQAGFVEREPDPNDRRGVSAVLTTAGRHAFRRAVPTHRKGVENHFLGTLNVSDKKALRSALKKVLAEA